MLSPSIVKEDPPRMENLPDDVLRNIFIRLEPKLVAQMRSVSKPLNALLSEPAFIKSHLNRSIQNNDAIPMSFHWPFIFRKLFMSHPSLSHKFIKLPANAPSENEFCLIIGSINGLVCFFSSRWDKHRSNIHIWNPCLSTFLTLPPCNIHSWCFHVLVRFGFDPKTDDYKVVNLDGLKKKRTNYRSHVAIFPYTKWLHAEVYSMRKGSWHPITQRFPSHVTRIHYRCDVCVDGLDGHAYWLGDLGEEKKLQTILVFDFGAETFSEIALPDSMAYDSEKHLAASAGNLCLISSGKEGQSEIWKTEKYGAAESWVKHYTFPQNCGMLRPFGLALSNDLLLTSSYKCVAFYNVNTGKVKYFMDSEDFLETKIVWYIESLVWIAPPKYALHCNFKRWKGNHTKWLQSFKRLICGGTGERRMLEQGESCRQ